MDKFKKLTIFASTLALFPLVSFAAMPASIRNLLSKIANLIVNPLIVLGFVVATVYLFWGIVKLIYKSSDGGEVKNERDTIKYGIIGLFIMFSVYGIINLLKATLNIP